MNKTKILKIVGIVLVAAVAALATVPIEGARLDASSWMEGLDDGARISELSIPGTHDSGATHSIADVAGKCQSLTIDEQLELGVRFLDIRLKLNSDKLDVVHSFVDQGASFDSVLSDMVSFVESNPTEFLIVSIKEDADADNSTVSFAEKLEEMLFEHSVVSRNTRLPETVGEARGKIYIVSRYDDASIGIPAYSGWRDSTSFELGELYVQDNYCISDVEVKKTDIESAFAACALGKYSLVLNFTSCYIDSGFPPTYAATPAREINPWLCEKIAEQNGSVGVLVCDFMTSELSEIIIGRNFK